MTGDLDPLDRLLAESLDDARLSRAERKGLAALLDDLPSPPAPADLRRRAIAHAREAIADAAGPAAAAVVDWLGEVLTAFDARQAEASGGRDRRDLAEVHFSPGDDCLDRILSLLREARRTVSICVFTITDDRIADAILDAHRREVSVRIITDDSKAEDLGSDVDRLGRAGIPVRIDRTPFHMHHKFAVFDGELALSGSYNWTRGAARDNEENVIVTGDPRLVGPFLRAFDRLWQRLA